MERLTKTVGILPKKKNRNDRIYNSHSTIGYFHLYNRIKERKR